MTAITIDDVSDDISVSTCNSLVTPVAVKLCLASLGISCRILCHFHGLWIWLESQNWVVQRPCCYCRCLLWSHGDVVPIHTLILLTAPALLCLRSDSITVLHINLSCFHTHIWRCCMPNLLDDCCRSSGSRERRSRSPRERDPVERTSRSRQQRSRSREHEYPERHVEYTRERSHERERDAPIVRERSRDRSRDREPYERSSRDISERGRVSSDSRRYESDRHRGSEREYSSSRSSRH